METAYRVVIVDDEPLARDIIIGYANQVPDLQTVAVCENTVKALEAIRVEKPDLVFLDIQMPGMTGLEMMQILPTDRPQFFLTTAYSQYAVESYDFDVLDYLLKPVPFELFMRTVVKFKEKKETNISRGEFAALSPANDSVWLRLDKGLRQLAFTEVLRIKGEKDYIEIFLDNEKILVHMNLLRAEQLFFAPVFLRIHKSHIVRQSAIHSIEGNTLKLSNGTELPIGPSYRQKLKEFIPLLK